MTARNRIALAPVTKPEYAIDPDVARFELAQFRPLRDYCVVLFDFIRDARVETVNPGGRIIIAGSAKQPESNEACWATVVSAGRGYWTSRDVFVLNPLRAGDRVLIEKQIFGDPIVFDGLEYRIIRGSGEYVLGVEEP